MPLQACRRASYDEKVTPLTLRSDVSVTSSDNVLVDDPMLPRKAAGEVL